jgi:YCII-related domain-containing protein
MSKFLVLYRADKATAEQMQQASPEEMQATMDQWMQWSTKAGPAIVELGAPLAPVTAGDGDWIGGFSILQADSAEAVQAVLAGHPHTAMGGTIDIHEFMPPAGS